MTLQEVESKNIKAIGYNNLKRELLVQMLNSAEFVYVYLSVPKQIYMDFANAKSKGKFFASNVKGQFDYVKIPKDMY
jgi:hypothetical protein